MKIEAKVFDYLNDLKHNNNREWFSDNRKQYEAVKLNVLSFTEAILKNLAETDSSLLNIDPKSCLFRINRDTRFSNNKDPYKTNMGIWINSGGKHSAKAGYYIHLEPSASFIGGGKYQPEAEELKKIRSEIDYNYKAFFEIIQSEKFINTFVGINNSPKIKLSRPPKGYEADNPAIEYLKLKSFTATKDLPNSFVLADDFINNALDIFTILRPLNEFINTAIEN